MMDGNDIMLKVKTYTLKVSNSHVTTKDYV